MSGISRALQLNNVLYKLIVIFQDLETLTITHFLSSGVASFDYFILILVHVGVSSSMDAIILGYLPIKISG